MLKHFQDGFQSCAKPDVTESFTGALIEVPHFVGPGETIVETAASRLPKALRLAKNRRPQSNTLHNQDALLADISNIAARAGYDIIVNTEPRTVGRMQTLWHFELKTLMTPDNQTTDVVSA